MARILQVQRLKTSNHISSMIYGKLKIIFWLIFEQVKRIIRILIPFSLPLHSYFFGFLCGFINQVGEKINLFSHVSG